MSAVLLNYVVQRQLEMLADKYHPKVFSNQLLLPKKQVFATEHFNLFYHCCCDVFKFYDLIKIHGLFASAIPHWFSNYSNKLYMMSMTSSYCCGMESFDTLQQVPFILYGLQPAFPQFQPFGEIQIKMNAKTISRVDQVLFTVDGIPSGISLASGTVVRTVRVEFMVLLFMFVSLESAYLRKGVILSFCQ